MVPGAMKEHGAHRAVDDNLQKEQNRKRFLEAFPCLERKLEANVRMF